MVKIPKPSPESEDADGKQHMAFNMTLQNGRLSYKDGQDTKAVDGLEKGKWHDFRLVLDLDMYKYDLYVDGRPAARGISFEENIRPYKLGIKSAWAEKGNVFYADSIKLTNGSAKPLTREEFVKGLVEGLNLSAESGADFKDVGRDKDYYAAVATARKLGIALGTGGNKFGAGILITRQDAYTMFARALATAEKLTVTEGTADADRFIDVAGISAYAKPYISMLVANGYLAEENEFGSEAAITADELNYLINKAKGSDE